MKLMDAGNVKDEEEINDSIPVNKAYFSQRYGPSLNNTKQMVFEGSRRSQAPVSNRISLTPKHKVQRDSRFHNGSPISSRTSKIRLRSPIQFSSSQNFVKEKSKNSNLLETKSSQDIVTWDRITNPLDIDDFISFGECTGQGGFAKVYEGYDKQDKREIAIKIMEKTVLINRKKKDIVKREISTLKLFDHTNICKYYKLLEDNLKVYIILELCGPMTLSKYCRRHPEQRLSEKKAFLVFRQIVQGLKHIHSRGYCHKDLKLTNILIDKSRKVKLIDFGFSVRADILINEFCGTPSYVPPELVQGKAHFGKPVDIWAIGVVLYKLLTNEYPFGAESDKMLKKNILEVKFSFPDYLSLQSREFIKAMVRQKPEDRLMIEEVRYSRFNVVQVEQHAWMRGFQDRNNRRGNEY